MCAIPLLCAPAWSGIHSPPAARGSIACAPGAWLGSFSGRRIDPLNDWVRPVSARACFPNEYLCRRWISEVQTWADLPGLMRCERLR